MKILIANGHNRLTGVTTFNLTIGQKLKSLGYEISFFILKIETQFDHVEKSLSEIGTVFVGKNTPPDCFDFIFLTDPTSQNLLQNYKGKKYFFIHGLGEQNLWPNEEERSCINHVFALSPFILSQFRLKFSTFSSSYVPNLIDTAKYALRESQPKGLRSVLLNDRRKSETYIEPFVKIGKLFGFQVSRINDYNFGYPIVNMQSILSEFDLVIGYGRSVLEAMSTGTPVFIFGPNGGDGFITADNFHQSFSRNCSGYGLRVFHPHHQNVWTLVLNDFKNYDPKSGVVNRQLALQHFDVHTQINRIVEFLK